MKILLNDPDSPRAIPNLIANFAFPLADMHGKGPLADALAPLVLVGCSLWRDLRRPGYVNLKLPSTTSRSGANFDFLRGASADPLDAGHAIQRFNAFLLAVFVKALPHHEATPLVAATLEEHPGATRGGLPDISHVEVEVQGYGAAATKRTPPKPQKAAQGANAKPPKPTPKPAPVRPAQARPSAQKKAPQTAAKKPGPAKPAPKPSAAKTPRRPAKTAKTPPTQLGGDVKSIQSMSADQLRALALVRATEGVLQVAPEATDKGAA
jgi:hypothetical protein